MDTLHRSKTLISWSAKMTTQVRLKTFNIFLCSLLKKQQFCYNFKTLNLTFDNFLYQTKTINCWSQSMFQCITYKRHSCFLVIYFDINNKISNQIVRPKLELSLKEMSCREYKNVCTEYI